MKKINFALLLAAIGFFMLFIGNWEDNARLRERLDKAEAVLDHMKAEHELAINATEKAMQAREEIHACEMERSRQLEKMLANDAFGNIIVPDGYRLLLRKNVCDTSAAANPASGH